MYTRTLKPLNHSFFLFGPRGSGKSTWLRQAYPQAYFIDLLPSENFLAFNKDPSELTKRVLTLPQNTAIVIDEIQRIPELLNEVHYLMETHNYKNFVMTGSSARKIRQRGTNLLAGRAQMYNFFPLTKEETVDEFKTENLYYGCLPMAVTAPNIEFAENYLQSYVSTYLESEVKAEALVRNLAPFHRFLEITALNAGTAVNLSGLARDVGISRDTVRGYLSVLEDTLMIRWLPAFRAKLKVREATKPKLYWFDTGVLNACAGYFQRPVPKDWDGILLEHWVHHELTAFYNLHRKKGTLSYWRTPAGLEVDFVWTSREGRSVGIEVKSGSEIRSRQLNGLRSFSQDQECDRLIVVYGGKVAKKIDDIEVLPVDDFLKQLYSGKILA